MPGNSRASDTGWICVDKMSNNQGQKQETDRYIVIHVATTCDEHGVYVTKDSAEVIEIGWLLLDAKNCEEVCFGNNLWPKIEGKLTCVITASP